MKDTCHGEQSDQHVCQRDVEEDGLAPPLAQATLAKHQGVEGKAVANKREEK